jgi:chromosome segregation ATPase
MLLTEIVDHGIMNPFIVRGAVKGGDTAGDAFVGTWHLVVFWTTICDAAGVIMETEDMGMSLEQKMDLMFEELRGARSQISRLGEQMDGLETQMDQFGKRLDGLETRMDQFDTRLDHMEGRITGLGQNIVELDERLTCQIEKLDGRIDGLEEKVDHLGKSVDEMDAKQELFGNVLERLASKVSLLHGQERANRIFIEFQLERKFAILDQDLSAVMDMILWLKNETMGSKVA